MKIERFDGEENVRPVGAAVVRAVANGMITLDLGPADGPTLFRVRMSLGEATRLTTSIRDVIANGRESVLILDD